jgi:hypothetical protein
VYIVPSHTERLERLKLLAHKKKDMQETGFTEIEQRHLLEDYMMTIWYLGNQTRKDYLNVLFA